ncbi:unnamed protein product [Arabidopsis halleri]
MAKADEICLDHHHPKIGREKPSNSSLIRSVDLMSSKVNETYDCWYTLGIPKIKLYRDSFFGCQANDLSFTDIVKQYSNVLSIMSCLGAVIHRIDPLSLSWLNGEATPKYWKDDVIAGIVFGFATSIITVFIVRILRHVKSWFPRACCSVKSQFSKVNLLVQVKRCMFASCLFLGSRMNGDTILDGLEEATLFGS